jgi:hypothetical protein
VGAKNTKDEKPPAASERTLKEATEGVRASGQRIQDAVRQLEKLRRSKRGRDEYGEDL